MKMEILDDCKLVTEGPWTGAIECTVEHYDEEGNVIYRGKYRSGELKMLAE